MRFFSFLLFLVFIFSPVLNNAALPKFLGGSGFGIKAKKANLENSYYPTYWEQLMQDQASANLKQGFYELAKHAYKAAEQTFAKATIKDPSKPYPHILLGVSLYWQGRLEEAMAEYRQALRLDPDNAQAHQLLGIAYAWKGQVNPALEHFKAAYKREPDRADINMNLGSTYGALDNYEDALFHFRRAVELEPSHPLYVYQLGSLYEYMGRDELASEAFRKAIKLYPYYEEAVFALGALSEKLSEPARAKAYYNKALSLKPGDSIARLRLVNLLLKQDKTEDAMEVIQRAFLISPVSNEGLALSVSYGGEGVASVGKSGEVNNLPDQTKLDAQLAQFKKRLSKIPAEEQISLQVQTQMTPKNIPTVKEDKKNELPTISSFDNKPNQELSNTFSRSFTLAPATQEGRQEQLDKLFNGLNRALKERAKDSNIKMFLQASALNKDAPEIREQNNSQTASNAIGGKATYNPYNVGNDMGLWVVGKTWLKYIEEVQEEIEQKTLKTPTAQNYILSGFMYLTLGQGSKALSEFNKAATLSKEDDLKIIYLLGQGTAAVILGQEEQAKQFYQEVLKIDQDNKIAKSNLEILQEQE